MKLFGWRVRCESTSNDPDLATESRTSTRVRDGRGECGRRVPDPEQGPSRTDVAAPKFIAAGEHVERFITWITTDHEGETAPVTLRDQRLFANYEAWARSQGVVPMPKRTLQTLLGKRTPQVRRKRVRIHDDATGIVIRLNTEARSPVRETVYVITPHSAPQEAHSAERLSHHLERLVA